MHLNTKLLFQEYGLKYFRNDMNVLEIGPIGYPSVFNKIVNNSTIKWYTLDIGTEFIFDGEKNPLHIMSEFEYNYPIEEEKFDIIISGNVMEHVRDIWKWIDELKRILKKGGLIITILPTSIEYHPAPYDCWRIYPEGMKALMAHKELDVLECYFDSMEKRLLPKNLPNIPGYSIMNLDGEMKLPYKLLSIPLRIPILNKILKPIIVAYDCICICRK